MGKIVYIDRVGFEDMIRFGCGCTWFSDKEGKYHERIDIGNNYEKPAGCFWNLFEECKTADGGYDMDKVEETARKVCRPRNRGSYGYNNRSRHSNNWSPSSDNGLFAGVPVLEDLFKGL